MMLWILVGTIGAWLAYVLIVFWALRSDAVRGAVNRHPDRFFITWRSASSWIPGSFHVEGVQFVGQGTDSQYFGNLREARFHVRLLPLLLFRREISVGTFHGRGIEFQLRRPSESGATNAAGLAVAPPIPGIETLPRRTAPRRSRGRPSWWIRIDKIDFSEIERIWIHGTRLEGPGTLEAALDMQVAGPFHIRARHLEFPEATVSHNGAGIASGLALNLSGDLGPLTFGVDDVPGDRLFEFISAELRLAGDIGPTAPSEASAASEASWLGDFLPAGSGVSLTGGDIRLDADLRTHAGGPIQGEVRLAGDTVSARIRDEDYEGSLRLGARLVDGAGGPGVLHLRDTELVLTNLHVPAIPRDTQEGWHATIAVPDGRLDLTNKSWRLDGRFHLEMRDTRPVLAILRSQPDAPGWLRLMPTLRDIEGSGKIVTSRDLTQITDAALNGKSTEFRAELLLAPGPLKGIVYARYGLVAAGFDKRSPEKPRWRVFGAKDWFEKARTNPFAPPDPDDREDEGEDGHF
ncbi:MAG: hypothetical protein AB7O66_00090 [Limisphaerales bacterium]